MTSHFALLQALVSVQKSINLSILKSFTSNLLWKTETTSKRKLDAYSLANTTNTKCLPGDTTYYIQTHTQTQTQIQIQIHLQGEERLWKVWPPTFLRLDQDDSSATVLHLRLTDPCFWLWRLTRPFCRLLFLFTLGFLQRLNQFYFWSVHVFQLSEITLWGALATTSAANIKYLSLPAKNFMWMWQIKFMNVDKH